MKPLAKRDEERLLKAGRSVFSTAFPNPNREGCPAQEVIGAIAFRKVDLAAYRDFMVHMSRCSPCFNDYATFRAQATRQRTRRWLAVAAAVLIVLGLGAWLWSRLQRSKGPLQFEAAAVDLAEWPTLRGPEGNPPHPPLQL